MGGSDGDSIGVLADPGRLSTLVRGLTDDPTDDIELDIQPDHLGGHSQRSDQEIVRYTLGGDDDMHTQHAPERGDGKTTCE